MSTEVPPLAVLMQKAQAKAAPATEIRKYLLPSANSNIILRSGRRIVAPDGIIYADTPELIEEMEEFVEVGNATYYIESGDKPELSPQQQPV